MSIYRTHVILFLISRCYGHKKFASFGSSEYTELSYIKINEKKGAHGISCDCWADSGTPPVCDLITPNPHNFFSFFTKDKEGLTRLTHGLCLVITLHSVSHNDWLKRSHDKIQPSVSSLRTFSFYVICFFFVPRRISRIKTLKVHFRLRTSLKPGK